MAKPVKAQNKFKVNAQVVPEDETAAGNVIGDKVRTPDDNTVCPAYYPFPNQEHGHHLADADRDVEMAVWSWGEQSRYVYTEDCYGDDSIGGNGKKKGNPY